MEPAPAQSTNLRTTNILKWMPIWKILILCGGSAICFLISYSNGNVSPYIPFRSETGSYLPESILFSLTLYFGAVSGAVIILYRFLILRYQLPLRDNRCNNMNRRSAILGFISMICLVGMASVPMSTVLPLHLFFSSAYFVFTLLYVNLQTTLSHNTPRSNTIWNQIRDSCCLLLAILMFMMTIFFPLSHFKWNKANPLAFPALKTPNDPYFGMMLTSSVIELLFNATFHIVIASFYFEFRNFELIYGIVPRQNGAPVTALELAPIL